MADVRTLIAILGAALLTGCVTMDWDVVSGPWSFRDSLDQNLKPWGFSVVDKSDGHPVRSGEKSMRFEVRSGDCSWARVGWDDCATQRERREKTQNGYNRGQRWYAWSLYLPQDFPVIWQAINVLGQFHNENHYQPPFMFQIQGEADVKTKKFTEYYTIRSLGGSHGNYRLIDLEEMRGVWSDFLIHANWSTQDDGFFRVYVNGEFEPAYEWSGSTVRRRHRNVYFKFGIYSRSVSGEVPTRIVYYDDVRKGKTCESVTEYFDCSRLASETP